MSEVREKCSRVELVIERLTPLGWCEESGGLSAREDCSVAGLRERTRMCLVIAGLLISLAILVADINASRTITAILVAGALGIAGFGAVLMALVNVAVSRRKIGR